MGSWYRFVVSSRLLDEGIVFSNIALGVNWYPSGIYAIIGTDHPRDTILQEGVVDLKHHFFHLRTPEYADKTERERRTTDVTVSKALERITRKDSDPISPLELEHDETNFIARLRSAGALRRFLATKDGYIGPTPGEARVTSLWCCSVRLCL